MIGQTVGNYRITKLLGEGGMGAVYLAEHPGIGRRAAVKVLHPDLTRHPDMATRFFNEARAANAIQHPGIVEVLDFGTLPTGVSYIVMEFLDGQSLAERLGSGGGVPIATAIDFTRQAAAALGAAHDKGIVHRDLKPDNLYVVPDPRNPGREMIKVLDFGIAKLGTGTTNSGSVKTRTGTVMGTPAYMSPEQCRGTKEVDHRTDIYALGIILYEMLCGAPPFVSEGHGELIHLHISESPPPPRSRNAAISPALETVVLRALAKEPDQRFASMGDLARALAYPASVTQLATPASSTVAPMAGGTMMLPSPTTLSAGSGMVETAPPRPAPTKRTRPTGLIAVGFLVVALGLGSLVAYRMRGTNPSDTASTHAEIGTRPQTVTPPPAPRPTAAPATEPLAARERSIPVAISTKPPGARVVRERDGAVMGITPLHDSWLASDGVEKLRLELAGYRVESLTVPLNHDVDLTLPLKRAAASPHKKVPVAHAGASLAAPTLPGPAPPPVVPAKPAALPKEPVPL